MEAKTTCCTQPLSPKSAIIFLGSGRLFFLRANIHTATAYTDFCSMKQLTVFLPPLGKDASLSQGYPTSILCVPIYTYTREKLNNVEWSFLSQGHNLMIGPDLKIQSPNI